MPNWCNNEGSISASKEKIDSIVDFLSSAGDVEDAPMTGLLEHLIPNPSGEWDYDWSVLNWGTKWDALIMDWSRVSENCVYLTFDTAWSPPIAAYDKLTEDGYTIDLSYHEEGMSIVGQYIDGKQETYEYSDMESLDDIPKELVENWILRDILEERAEMEIEEADEE